MLKIMLRNFASLVIFSSGLMLGCSDEISLQEVVKQDSEQRLDNSFSIVVIPDTQNSVDYLHQKESGFALDSRNVYLDEMEDIAKRSVQEGGNLAFVTAVGDVWQHQTLRIDSDHGERGFGTFSDPEIDDLSELTDKVLNIEIPIAIEGYQFLRKAGIPFGVVPGNHDYDAKWHETLTESHIGGLENFLSAFGEDSEFFQNKPWYISSYNGGTSSAQRFRAGEYIFLHFSFEMQPSDDVLEWAQSLIDLNPGLPTIISTHDYLDPQGERRPYATLDLANIDPNRHNSADQVWEKFIRNNDQIFMVLCGHQRGQAMRIDINDAGNQVYQILSNYQDRGQAGLDVGQALSSKGTPMAIGDGWYRIMDFNLEEKVPYINVSTYSNHYQAFSSELDTYASWYKNGEHPDMTDSEFYSADEFKITLTDFHKRFKRFEKEEGVETF